ncbi:L-threonylcarbamoyladenylate synthase [Nocardioides sp. B-3]|uniref:L-threonylcarbamoyladenylate synthase n=1 Tax=Nocardioides sp. B-3 TaxID=2895565 RepID=UPI0021525B1B|nr:Sua5/YciO/YrdC/YwlC family protein [Nocardioides sp. B-3]
MSSANLSGRPAARTADEAEAMLGDSVEVIVDAGTSAGADASTIVDCTDVNRGRILRRGAISLDELNAVLDPLGIALTDEG